MVGFNCKPPGLNHEDLQWMWNIEIITEEALELLGTLLICFGLNAMIPRRKPLPEFALSLSRQLIISRPAAILS
ncbi:MAG: hypothetical protein KAR11_05910 [Phycisphaerae bacterium]|nr:hypothetical protein [Phycisphaerae bacterium]